MLSAGSLNERVGVLVPTVKRGEYGEQETVFVKKRSLWASVTFQRGAKALTAGEPWMSGSVAVMMRDNPLINDRCRLEWDGKIYAIESFNRSKTDGSISIVCNVIDEGSNVEK